jgi:murein L,D-transpeptidase YcbB/YkuD
MADEQETTEQDVDDTAGTEEETEAAESETDETADATAEDEWKPPTREEWDKHQKALKDAADKLSKVNKESTQRRLKIRELEAQNEDDAAKAQREAAEAAQARYKPVVAKSALLEANARTDRVGALIKLLNMDSLEFDGNDEVVGLDLEVTRLQDEYPEFFTQSEPEKPASLPAPKPAPKAAAASKKPARDEPKSAGELIAARLMGKSP